MLEVVGGATAKHVEAVGGPTKTRRSYYLYGTVLQSINVKRLSPVPVL